MTCSPTIARHALLASPSTADRWVIVRVIDGRHFVFLSEGQVAGFGGGGSEFHRLPVRPKNWIEPALFTSKEAAAAAMSDSLSVQRFAGPAPDGAASVEHRVERLRQHRFDAWIHDAYDGSISYLAQDACWHLAYRAALMAAGVCSDTDSYLMPGLTVAGTHKPVRAVYTFGDQG